MASIAPGSLRERLRSADGAWPLRNWALFDVRDVGESQCGHIRSATFLPRHMIEFRIANLVPAPATPITLYDSGEDGDRRADRACGTLRSLGYTDIACLDGGYAAWTAAGFDVATGWNVPSKLFGEEIAHSGEASHLSADELAAKIEAGEGPRILDVRTEAEYRHGSLPESISAPSFDWALHILDLDEDARDIVLHCAGRTRSIIGAATARMLGLPRVRALEDGTMGWILSGRPLEKHQKRRLASPSASSRRTMSERAWRAAEKEGVRRLSPHELSDLVTDRARKSLYLFDVRDRKAAEGERIGTSIPLPGGQACQRADDFVPVPASLIVFVDDGDSRAAITAYWFRRMGFPQVGILDGGVPAWRASGYPLEDGNERAPPLGLGRAEAATRIVSGDALNEALLSPHPPLVVDVGSSVDFASGHIAGARWLPRGRLEERMSRLASAETPVVVTAKRSEQAVFAAATLAALGFRDVARLGLEWKRWSEHLPVATGLSAEYGPPTDVLAIPYLESRERMREYLEWEKRLARETAS